MQMMLQQMLDISKGCHTEGMDWGGKKKGWSATCGIWRCSSYFIRTLAGLELQYN